MTGGEERRGGTREGGRAAWLTYGGNGGGVAGRAETDRPKARD